MYRLFIYVFQVTLGNNLNVTLNLKDELVDESEAIKNKEREERNKYLKEKFNKMEKKNFNGSGNKFINNNKNINKKREREDIADDK